MVLLIAQQGAAFGQEAAFHAGVARPSVAAAAPFEMLVWYPTQDDEVAWQAGPFSIRAARNAAVAAGRFPIVLLSHGGGLGGGTPLVLGELSAALARRGLVVIAPFHGKTGLAGRPQQIRQALDAVLVDRRFADHADPGRLGMIGFSLGGAVTLELAGAVPNVAHLIAYCSAHPGDAMSCDHAPGGARTAATGVGAPAPLALRAIVLLDPYAVLFQRAELVGVTMPVLILRPAQSELPGQANAIGLTAALPQAPAFRSVPGGHFVFTDICSAALKATSPEVCQDPPDVDRAAVHIAIEGLIGGFLSKKL